jgi:hypothetical protein
VGKTWRRNRDDSWNDHGEKDSWREERRRKNRDVEVANEDSDTNYDPSKRKTEDYFGRNYRK